MIQNIRFHDTIDTIDTAFYIRFTYPVPRMINWNLSSIWRDRRNIDIMHTFQIQRNRSIDFDNDFLRMLHKNRRITNTRT